MSARKLPSAIRSQISKATGVTVGNRLFHSSKSTAREIRKKGQKQLSVVLKIVSCPSFSGLGAGQDQPLMLPRLKRMANEALLRPATRL